jgi:hypothetical protein
MPGSTGPDLNTYIIPEVELGDTFNYWRDTTNTMVYKLNKLKVYDAVDSGSIGATYGTTGAWQAFIQPTVTTGHTFSGLVALAGGLSAAWLYVSGGTTLNSTLTVSGGTTLSSTLSVGGIARFSSGVCAAHLWVTGGTTLAGTVWLGDPATGNYKTSVYGSLNLRYSTPLLFLVSNNTSYVGFQAPASVSSSVTWTLPSGDGTPGHVLSTNGTGTLAWKAADGVTGTDTQVQYNQGGAPGATSSFLFHYSTAAGYSAGTLGVSGGAYVLGNVGIGVTGQNIGSRIVHGTGASAARGKLEVAGDVRIPFGGFFVNKNIIVPAGVCGSVGTDENAFLSGTLTVASGATLTVESGGSIVIL